MSLVMVGVKKAKLTLAFKSSIEEQGTFMWEKL